MNNIERARDVRICYMITAMREAVKQGIRNPVLSATVCTALAFDLGKKWAYDYSNDPERNYRADGN